MHNAIDRAAPAGKLKLRDCASAVAELALARLRLGSIGTRAKISASAGRESPRAPDQRELAIIDRVGFIIPRIAARLPWRADCLVQALAAQRWLARRGISSAIQIGVPRHQPAKFEAHAWLSAGGRIVTGGNIDDYERLTRR